MKAETIKKIKNLYPENQFNVVKSKGSLIVSPKTAQIRVYKKQFNRAMATMQENGSQAVTNRLDDLIKLRKLVPEDFEQTQVLINKSCRETISQEAKKCRVRKIVYLERLLH